MSYGTTISRPAPVRVEWKGNLMVITEKIKYKARELGYTACGIIPSTVFEEYSRYLSERVAAFPESKKLYEPLYAHAQPPVNGKSIIVCIQ